MSLSAKLDDAELSPLVVVVGPTASGKTSLAVQLAERYHGEVVSADSVQIYRYFDIGSGKPTVDEQRDIAHHLIGIIEPDQEMDASLFAQAAVSRISDIRSRGKLPIVCGGTFLWTKALLYGLAPAPPKDDEIRARHQRLAEEHGRAFLHAELERVDRQSAQRLNPNDLVRVSRALEVVELTGVPLSVFQRQHGFAKPRYRARLVGIRHERDALAERIEKRVVAMFARGWLDEVRDLIGRGYGSSRPMTSVGYRQVKAVLDAGTPIDLPQLVRDIAQVTRVFSRRQRTWLREHPVEWLDPERAAKFELDPADLRPVAPGGTDRV